MFEGKITGAHLTGDVDNVGKLGNSELREKFAKSRGSYLSPMFSNRLRSSSNIDFLASTDLTISDG